ncbi:NAD-binding protein, partial [Vibrio parahaemolyticus]|nr:NAD-binding protein [Vibrio parahaemolyticus]
GPQKGFAPTLTQEEESVTSHVVARRPRVIIAGFGRFGQIVGRLMYANKIKVTVVERDASQMHLLRKYGSQVCDGDA